MYGNMKQIGGVIMKIKTRKVTYEYAVNVKKPKHIRPKKPLFLLSVLIRILSIGDLFSTKFQYTKENMEKAGKGPYFILMNHSSFIDPKIASKIFFPKRYCIVVTTDSFVGKAWLMRKIGCIPTQKYVSDITLITDILHALKKEKTSVLMYPEAGYSFDGKCVGLPEGFGRLIKKINVPVVSVITNGAYLRDPLYNGLQKRKVKVTAKVKCILSQQDTQKMTVKEIDEIIKNTFSFDAFKEQWDSKIRVCENFRADGLNRILYKCPNCKTEHKTKGTGTKLFCTACGKSYTLTEYGKLEADNGNTEFSHIPDWYDWQRECVKKEISENKYSLETDVDIGIITDYKALYFVGSGHLSHNNDGFVLTGCDGKLEYRQSPLFSFSLNADYFWYEIGDVICIGNKDKLYYCFPKEKDIVTKARFATEELYKLLKKNVKK